MYSNILIPVAPDHERSMTKAIELAETLRDKGGKITLLTVLEAMPAYVTQFLPEGQVTKNVVDAKINLQEDADGHKNTDIKVIVGHSANSILEYANENETDCIIIASHRPNYQDYFLGSTAARVVRHATCAVHVLR
jgi:nucleotide-binding universal stress UspA family protein